MSESATATVEPTAETAAPPSDPDDESTTMLEGHEKQQAERRVNELGIIGRAMLATKVRESGVMNKSPEERTDSDKALLVYEQLRTGKNLTTGEPLQDVSFQGGNDLLMPKFSASAGDTELNFGKGEVRLAGITQVNPDGSYSCYFEDVATGEPITFVGKNEDGTDVDMRFEIDMPKDAVIDAQIAAEPAYQTLFTGDKEKVFKAFVDSRPQNNPDYVPDASIDDALEKSAKATGIPTSEMMSDLIKAEQPDESKRSGETTALLTKLAEGDVIIDKADFKQAMDVLGMGKEGFSRETDNLLEQLQEQTDKLAEASEEAKSHVQEKIDEIKGKIKLLGAAKKMWEAAEAGGTDPIAKVYDMAMKGELDLVKLVQGKDLVGLVQQLPEFSNLSEDEKRAIMDSLKSGSWKALKGGGILLIIIAALGVGVLAVAGSALGPGMMGAMKQ